MKTVLLSMEELPPTLNDIIGIARRHKFASANVKKQWSLRLAPLMHGLSKFRGKVYLECVWRIKNRRRDPDNVAAALKFPLDALVNAKVIKDDNSTVIQSPIIHHIVIADNDGFTLYLRDKQAFEKRLKENILLPPAYPISGKPTKSRLLAQ